MHCQTKGPKDCYWSPVLSSKGLEEDWQCNCSFFLSSSFRSLYLLINNLFSYVLCTKYAINGIVDLTQKSMTVFQKYVVVSGTRQVANKVCICTPHLWMKVNIKSIYASFYGMWWAHVNVFLFMHKASETTSHLQRCVCKCVSVCSLFRDTTDVLYQPKLNKGKRLSPYELGHWGM